MKKILGILATVLTAGALFAQTQTTNTLATQAAAYRDATIIQDQSKIPDQDNRVGYLFAWYDVAKHGGAVGTVALSEALPDNTLIRDGYVQVITPIAPATSTGAVGVVTAGDLIADGTTLQTAGFYDIVPNVWSITTASTNAVEDGAHSATNLVLVSATIAQAADIQLATATNRVEFDISGSAATQGVFAVYLDLIYAQ